MDKEDAMYIYVCVCVYTYPLVDGHLDSFHTLAVVDSAAINIGVHVPLRISSFILWINTK